MMSGRSSGIGARGRLPARRDLRRKREPDLGRELLQRLRHEPGTGQRTEPGARAGDDGPVVTGDDIEPETAAEHDQGLEGVFLQARTDERRAA